MSALASTLGGSRKYRTESTTNLIWDKSGISAEVDQEGKPTGLIIFTDPNLDAKGPAEPYAHFPGTLNLLGVQIKSGDKLSQKLHALAGAGFEITQEDENGVEWTYRTAKWTIQVTALAEVITEVDIDAD
jgi:hypothetical protein